MTENTTTAAPAATQPEAIGLALDVLREALSEPDQRLDQCPARMTRAHQAARALAGVQAAPAAQEAEPAKDESLADIGAELLRTLASNADHPALQGWAPIGCPSEVVVDLLNMLDEARPQADAGAVPGGRSVLPVGWVPLSITHEGQHPEEVAYGPQVMMDRLGKWLQRYFGLIATAPQAPAAAKESVLIDGVEYSVPAAVAGELLRLHMEALAAPAAAVAPAEPLQDFDSPRAQALMRAWEEGWEACRDADFVGEEAQNDAFNRSETVNRCIAEDMALTATASAPTQEADGWMPIETAPDGERVLLGPRHAPVVGTVHQPAHWHEEQEPTATVVHYNGTTLVAGYRCSEWRRLPGAVNAKEAEDAARLTQAELQEVKRAADEIEDCGETDVNYDLLLRAAMAGYLECARFRVLDQSALDRAAARARQEGGAAC